VAYEIVRRTHQNASFSHEKIKNKFWGGGTAPPQNPPQVAWAYLEGAGLPPIENLFAPFK